MSTFEKQPETDIKREDMDTTTARYILEQTAEVIPPADPSLFARIEESIAGSSPASQPQQAHSISPLQALLNMVRDYFRKPQLAWGIVAVQAIVLCIFIASTPVKNNYHTLSAGQTDMETPAGSTFYVIFQENARLRDIEQLLTRTNGTIINGPGKRGIYTIRFQPAQAATGNNMLASLKDSSLITFIERAY